MNIKSKIFDNGIIVKSRKSAIIFEDVDGKEENTNEAFTYEFTSEELIEFVEYLQKVANESWADIILKEANSYGSDYYEYFDKKYDNNGYLVLIKNGIKITAPYTSTDTLYQFNKAKIQSFIYDLLKVTNGNK